MSSKRTMIGAVAAASLLTGGLLFVTLDEESHAVAKAQPAAAPAPTV